VNFGFVASLIVIITAVLSVFIEIPIVSITPSGSRSAPTSCLRERRSAIEISEQAEAEHRQGRRGGSCGTSAARYEVAVPAMLDRLAGIPLSVIGTA